MFYTTPVTQVIRELKCRKQSNSHLWRRLHESLTSSSSAIPTVTATLISSNFLQHQRIPYQCRCFCGIHGPDNQHNHDRSNHKSKQHRRRQNPNTNPTTGKSQKESKDINISSTTIGVTAKSGSNIHSPLPFSKNDRIKHSDKEALNDIKQETKKILHELKSLSFGDDWNEYKKQQLLIRSKIKSFMMNLVHLAAMTDAKILRQDNTINDILPSNIAPIAEQIMVHLLLERQQHRDIQETMDHHIHHLSQFQLVHDFTFYLLMFKYAIQTCIPPSHSLVSHNGHQESPGDVTDIHTHSKSSIRNQNHDMNDIRRATYLLEELLNFVESHHNDQKYIKHQEDATLWQGTTKKQSHNRAFRRRSMNDTKQQFAEANNMINSCFALVSHALLKNYHNQNISPTKPSTSAHEESSVFSNTPKTTNTVLASMIQRFSRLDNDINDTIQEQLGDNNSANVDCTLVDNIPSSKKNHQHNTQFQWQPNTTFLNALIHTILNHDPSNNNDLSDTYHHSLFIAKELIKSIITDGHGTYSVTTADDQQAVVSICFNGNESRPNIVTFNLLLDGYAKGGFVDEVESFYTWWIDHCLEYQQYHRMKYATDHNRCSSKANSSAKIPISFVPDIKTFNIMLKSYAKQGSPEALVKAKYLLQWMNDDHSYLTSLIVGDTFIKRIQDDYLLNIQPDVVSYTTIISALANNGNAIEAHNLLHEMIETLEQGDGPQPDYVTFACVVDAWAKSKHDDAVDKCWDIIHIMEKMINSDMCQEENSITSTSIISNKNQIMTGASESLRVAFNSLIYAIANSQNNDVGNEALQVVNYMERLKDTICINPNVTTYNSVLLALGKSNRFNDAKNLFDRMCDNDSIEINTISYNTFLDMLSRSKFNDAPEQALCLLDEMKSTNIANTRTYNIVMNVLAKSGHRWCHQAEVLLDEMETLVLKDKENVQVMPNTISYSTLIHAIARSSLPMKAQRAMDVVRRMEDFYDKSTSFQKRNATPNTLTYNGVLNACCFVNKTREEKDMALEISHIVLEEMMSGRWPNCLPDHVTYATMLKVLSRHMPKGDEQYRAIKHLYLHCRSNNKLSSFVLKELRRSIPKEMYDQLTSK